MRRICVFCGSSLGNSPDYAHAAARLGRHLAEQGIELIYGGGNVGLMGEVANAALQAGGRVTGIIPRALMEMEVGHVEASRLIIVDSMHERKAMMAEQADGFIALPGGIGTMEELFEIWTWGQLGLHTKPAGFLDVNGYYNHLWGFLDHMLDQGFLRPRHRTMIGRHTDPAMLLAQLRSFVPPEVVKILGRDTA